MSDTFRTIQSPSEGIYKEKGSKFLGFAIPVSSEEEVTTTLKAFRKKYYDARHVCYAFVIGPTGHQFQAADDGEPSNSAGPPILGAINSLELTNVLVIVVRYFGGTKLGVGGLIKAYRTAAQEALNEAEIVTGYEEDLVQFRFQYPEMNVVMSLIKELNLTIEKQDFENDCIVVCSVRKSVTQMIIGKLDRQPVSVKIID